MGDLQASRTKPRKRGGPPTTLGAVGLPEALEDLGARLLASVSDEDVAAYDAERERERRLERMRDASVLDVLPPEVVALCAHDQLRASAALTHVRRWVAYQRGERKRGDKPILALIGDMGRGKTVAAAWLLASEGGRYVEAEDLSRMQSAKWGDDRDAYRRILSTGVLVVDELGTEGDARPSIHDVVNRRQGRRLTLLLGNLSKQALKDRLDPRTWDRMRTCAAVIEVHGESMRKGEP